MPYQVEFTEARTNGLGNRQFDHIWMLTKHEFSLNPGMNRVMWFDSPASSYLEPLNLRLRYLSL